MNCSGTGKIPTNQSYKMIAYTRKYECPDCGKYVGTNSKGEMNAHKPAKQAETLKMCPQCETEGLIKNDDYICIECRNTTDTRFIGLFESQDTIVALYIKDDVMKLTIDGNTLTVRRNNLTIDGLEGIQRWINK